MAFSGYLIRHSFEVADNTCSSCGGNIIVVRLTLPLPADNILIPIEETRGHWRAAMRRVTLCAAIRTARETRRITATRRLERQRRGEVPPLAHGYVDITSNYYTGY